MREEFYCTIKLCIDTDLKNAYDEQMPTVVSRVACRQWQIHSRPVFGCKLQNSKKNFRHIYGELNLDEIKNALRLLSVNGEANLMNLIRL